MSEKTVKLDIKKLSEFTMMVQEYAQAHDMGVEEMGQSLAFSMFALCNSVYSGDAEKDLAKQAFHRSCNELAWRSFDSMDAYEGLSENEAYEMFIKALRIDSRISGTMAKELEELLDYFKAGKAILFSKIMRYTTAQLQGNKSGATLIKELQELKRLNEETTGEKQDGN